MFIFPMIHFARNTKWINCCSVTKSCPTLCDFMNCSTPGFSVLISQSLLRLMSIALVMPSSHLILCHPLLLLPSLFPRIRVLFCFFFFPMNRLFASGGQYIHIYMQIFSDSFYTICEWFSKALTKKWHTGELNKISICGGNYNSMGFIHMDTSKGQDNVVKGNSECELSMKMGVLNTLN